MARKTKVNDRQLAVLVDLADGRREVTSEDWSRATTVYALSDRGLVEIRRLKGGWSAHLTDAGRSHVEMTRRPDPSSAEVAANIGTVSAGELLDLLAPTGSFTVADPDPPTRASWRRAIHQARQEGAAPVGHALRYRGRSRGDLVIELTLADPVPRPEPIPVDDLPASGRWAAMADELERSGALARVSGARRNRAVRLLSALGAEAVRRGYQVGVHTGDKTGGYIQVGSHAFQLEILEELESVDRLPTAEEMGQRKLYEWQRLEPRTEVVPSGRLALDLGEHVEFSGRKRRRADRPRWRLDDKLGNVLAEIEARAGITEQRRAAEHRAKDERKAKWEVAMARARAAFIQERKRGAVRDQAAVWAERSDIDDYCEALDRLADQESDVGRARAIREWANWGREVLAEIDPLVRWPLDPGEGEPELEQLRPYLGGWSEPAWVSRRLHTLEVRMESWTRTRRRSGTRRS